MNSKFHVPFETAKQLREKGYNCRCDYYYAPDGQMYWGVTMVSNDKLDYENNGTIAAPTYHEVMDWLDGKGITIETQKHYVTGDYYGWNSYIQRSEYDRDFVKFVNTTREEALNAAILKALEML